MTETIDPIARHPFTGTDLAPERKGHQERTIRRAVAELWNQSEMPTDVAMRNRAVWHWYRMKGIASRYWPSDRHLRRVFNGR